MKYLIFYWIDAPELFIKQYDPNLKSDLTIEALLDKGGNYRPVSVIDANSPQDAYEYMQAENWSPNGEARPLIEALGLQHTSMSVGDVLVDERENVMVVKPIGFEHIANMRIWREDKFQEVKE